ncbi:MAG: ATP-binding cassette, subfamily bacterial CydD [Solirubrobacterales bacterium]|nr:ATP-binding cassette, subfamily bacterial CydD [Solirubrobacterales bacterium]
MSELQRRLARSGGAARRQLGVTVVLGLAATVLLVAQATLLAEVISGAFLGARSLGALAPKLIALAAIAVARGAVAFGFEASGRIGAARVMAGLRAQMVERLLRSRPGALAAEQSGELAAAAVQGVDALEAYFARYLPQVVLAALVPPVILAWVLPRDWEAALILAVTFPLIPVFMVLIGKLAAGAVRRRWRTLSSLSASFLDVVSGLETLQAFGRAADQERAIEGASDRYRLETMATLRVGFLSALVLELLAMIGMALVAATVGVQLAGGSLGLTAGLTILILAPELYMPLRQMGAQFHASADGVAAAERIYEIIDAPEAVTRPRQLAPAPDPREHGIRVSDVSFSYPGRPGRVLDGASLDLRAGETLAVLGASGSGKTTLASILMRLSDPDSGGVSCGGVDLARVEPAAWRERIAWLPQRPTIFSATVADNIRLADPSASAERVRDAAGRAEALGFVAALPEGFDTLLGDGGRRLSAGQCQRVALARAFLANPSLVILDEPTSNIDATSAELVWQAIERLVSGRTAILVVHRPALARFADRMVELRAGALVECSPRPSEHSLEAAA